MSGEVPKIVLLAYIITDMLAPVDALRYNIRDGMWCLDVIVGTEEEMAQEYAE